MLRIFFSALLAGCARISSVTSKMDGGVLISESPFRLGASSVVIEEHSKPKGDSSPLLLLLHENEETGFKVAKEILAARGGRAVRLHHNDGKQRLVTFPFNDKTIIFDPNRIFTSSGLAATIDKYTDKKNQDSRAAAQIGDLADWLIKNFVAGRTVVAVHNNARGGYSIESYLKGGAEAPNAKSVHLAEENESDEGKLSPDNFFLVTDPGDYDRLSKQGFNVILQNDASGSDKAPKNVIDDGSLSVYCGWKKIRYINVEAEHGAQTAQRAMLDAVFDLLARE